jgi:hypothetical protein
MEKSAEMILAEKSIEALKNLRRTCFIKGEFRSLVYFEIRILSKQGHQDASNLVEFWAESNGVFA